MPSIKDAVPDLNHLENVVGVSHLHPSFYLSISPPTPTRRKVRFPVFTTTDRPPDNASGPGLRLIRASAKTPIIGTITSDRLLGVNTHYYSGRTQPCSAPDCRACADAIPWRWHAYISLILDDTSEHTLLELTASAVAPIVEYQDLHTTLTAARLKVTRPNGRPNGRVWVQIKPPNEPTIALPPPPNIPRTLCHIWNIPYDAVEPARRQHDADTITADADTIRNKQHLPPNPRPAPNNPAPTPRPPANHQPPKP